jgi:hypothetical protein
MQNQLNSLSGYIFSNLSSSNTIINYNYTSMSGQINSITNNYNLQNYNIISLSGTVYNITQQLISNNNINNYFSIYVNSLSGAIYNNYSSVTNSITNNYNNNYAFMYGLSGVINFNNNTITNIVNNNNNTNNLYLSSLSGAISNNNINIINSISNNNNNIYLTLSSLSGIINYNNNNISNIINNNNNSSNLYFSSLSGSINSINNINISNTITNNNLIASISGVVFQNYQNQNLINLSVSGQLKSINDNKYIINQPLYLPYYNSYISLQSLLNITNTNDFIQNQINIINTSLGKISGSSTSINGKSSGSSIGSVIGGLFTAAAGAATIGGFYLVMQMINSLRAEMAIIQLELIDLDSKVALMNFNLRESQKDIRDLLLKCKYVDGQYFQSDLNVIGNLNVGTTTATNSVCRMLGSCQVDGDLNVTGNGSITNNFKTGGFGAINTQFFEVSI